MSVTRAADAAPSEARTSRFVEFLLVGGATLFLFPLLWLFRRGAGLDSSELAVGFVTFYAAHVINDPHFAVTYMLFYKDVRRRALGAEYTLAQRARYIVAGVVVPIVLTAWALAGLTLHSAQTLGWLVQLMFLLVGWHYVKQGFGVLIVLSARRGATVTPRERAIILAHCACGWAFAWVNPSVSAQESEEKGVVYMAFARPRWFELTAGVALGLSTVALVWILVAKWRREGRALPLAPLLGFLVTVWVWTIFSSVDPLMIYVIPALHSIQYLYFVWLMKRNEAREHEGPPSFGRPVAVRLGLLALSATALGWLLFHGAPAFLDTAFVARARHVAIDAALGETPYFAALFAIVNIHHYFMDHVIWRRDNPETRYLRA